MSKIGDQFGEGYIYTGPEPDDDCSGKLTSVGTPHQGIMMSVKLCDPDDPCEIHHCKPDSCAC